MNGSNFDELILKNGGRRAFWVSQVAVIESFIKATLNDLVKINVATHATPGLGKQTGDLTAAAGKTILWDPTRGGMRMPHLHYAGEIYLLNESQWATFSKRAMTALTEKLGRVEKVTFDSVMEVSEAVAGM